MNEEQDAAREIKNMNLKPCPFCGVVPKMWIKNSGAVYEPFEGKVVQINKCCEAAGGRSILFATLNGYGIDYVASAVANNIAEEWNRRA